MLKQELLKRLEEKMSNTICVERAGRHGFYVFRWDNDKLMAFIDGYWREVKKTCKKNRWKDFVFVEVD
jgi:hypothetical protein